jgi:imidazolonepropionase-like amidohydrolase
MASTGVTTRVTDRPRLVAIRAGWLFDGRSATLLTDPVLLVDGPTIVAVDRAVPPPPDARIVDLTDATLLPGLIDTHVHLAFDASADPVTALAGRDDNAALAAMRDAGRTALHAGITTVRDLGDRDYLSLRLRGSPDLPTILAAGPPITTPTGHCHFLGAGTEPTPQAVRTAVREHADHGVDIIKVMASGGTMTPGSRQELAQFPPDLLRAIVEQAHQLGLPVTAHAHATTAIRDALDAGVDGIEHVSFWSADGIDDPGDLVTRIVASRVAVDVTASIAPAPGTTPRPGLARRLPRIIANTRRLYEAGAHLILGSDAGIGRPKPHDVLRYGITQTAQIGMPPAVALRLATSTAAAACGLATSKGQLAAGFDADILAVDGNPLLDLTALHHTRAVFARGTQVTPVPPLR